MYIEQFEPAIPINEIKKLMPDIIILYRTQECDKYVARYDEYMFELNVNNLNEVIKINSFRSDYTVKEVFSEMIGRLRKIREENCRAVIE